MPDYSIKDILSNLWKKFWISMSLPILLFIGVVILQKLEIRIIPPGSIRIWGILLFVLAAAFGVALPILQRTSFHDKFLKDNNVNIAEYIEYQKRLFILCSIAVVPASFAYMFIVSPLYMYGSVLAALYGIYSTLPFKDKITKELRMYKIEGQIES
ncbi:MAG: hypothetical protein J7L71_10090 [Spirochaetaceae bacterium]|nr:hypothetical protein [Spirochaetaceae bacterium]